MLQIGLITETFYQNKAKKARLYVLENKVEMGVENIHFHDLYL